MKEILLMACFVLAAWVAAFFLAFRKIYSQGSPQDENIQKKGDQIMIENIENGFETIDIRKDKNWIAFDIFGVSIQINFASSKGRYWLSKPTCVYIDPWNCAKEFVIDIAEGTCKAYDTIEPIN